MTRRNILFKFFQRDFINFFFQVYLFYIQLEGMKQGFEHGVKRGRKTIEDLEFVDFL